jgi:hypothetical protein
MYILSILLNLQWQLLDENEEEAKEALAWGRVCLYEPREGREKGTRASCVPL